MQLLCASSKAESQAAFVFVGGERKRTVVELHAVSYHHRCHFLMSAG